jgi:hypothetical protein
LGVYRIVGPYGRTADAQRTVAVARGDRLPPTPEAGQRCRLVDSNKRKASA